MCLHRLHVVVSPSIIVKCFNRDNTIYNRILYNILHNNTYNHIIYIIYILSRHIPNTYVDRNNIYIWLFERFVHIQLFKQYTSQ